MILCLNFVFQPWFCFLSDFSAGEDFHWGFCVCLFCFLLSFFVYLFLTTFQIGSSASLSLCWIIFSYLVLISLFLASLCFCSLGVYWCFLGFFEYIYHQSFEFLVWLFFQVVFIGCHYGGASILWRRRVILVFHVVSIWCCFLFLCWDLCIPS